MTTLVVATTFSELFRDVVIREIHVRPVIVVDFSDDIRSLLKQAKISPIAIRVQAKMGWGERDSSFKQLAMPGKQLDFCAPGTVLPVWEVLSIDRLSFWFRGRTAQMEYEALMGMDWKRALVPMDLHHPLPYALARHSGREVVGVQTGSLRTREWHDLVKAGLPFSSVVVSSEKDRQLLEHWGYTKGAVV